jgi:hypothetical protein
LHNVNNLFNMSKFLVFYQNYEVMDIKFLINLLLKLLCKLIKIKICTKLNFAILRSKFQFHGVD